MYGDNTRENVNILGGWLGTYRYGGLEVFRSPVRFEASFRSVLPDSSQVYGEIVDDCALGAASLEGWQSGREVRFSKSYKHGSRYEVIGRTEYAGFVSDDGTVMRGTWRLEVRAHGILLVSGFGTWQARRMWSEEDSSKSLAAQDELNDPIRTVAGSAW